LEDSESATGDIEGIEGELFDNESYKAPNTKHPNVIAMINRAGLGTVGAMGIRNQRLTSGRVVGTAQSHYSSLSQEVLVEHEDEESIVERTDKSISHNNVPERKLSHHMFVDFDGEEEEYKQDTGGDIMVIDKSMNV
jgi:hypothetical protein